MKVGKKEEAESFYILGYLFKLIIKIMAIWTLKMLCIGQQTHIFQAKMYVDWTYNSNPT
jgi:hypothetical protein